MNAMAIPIEGALPYARGPLARHIDWYVWAGMNLASAISHIKDTTSAKLIRYFDVKLQGDILFIKGARDAVREVPRHLVIDGKQALTGRLAKLETTLDQLQQAATATRDRLSSSMPRLCAAYGALIRTAETLRDEMAEFRWAICDHDAAATSEGGPSDDVKRVLATMQRDDDVSPERRAALQGLVRRSPEALADDRRQDTSL